MPAADIAAALRGRLAAGLSLGWAEVGAHTPDPREAAHVAGAVPRRQQTFAAGRAAARLAMGRDVALPVGPGRRPVWPADLTGSISHSDRAALALVAARADFASVAVDVEAEGRVAPEFHEHLFAADEDSAAGFQADAAFSGKEALFKLLHPLTDAWFGFHAARARVTDGAVHLRLVVPVGPFPAGWETAGPVGRAAGQLAVALWLPAR